MNEKVFRIYRPLIFLCGPKYDDKNPFDRRRILFEYIKCKKERLFSNKKNGVAFYLVPVIVDKIFDDDSLINSLGLNMKMLEEIVASISYRTYIFLDSLSTGFEYGLFDNNVIRNNSFIFLEKDYKKRKRRAVGEYLRKSIPSSNLITYDYDGESRDYIKKEYINFPVDKSGNPVIPIQIKDKIDEDFNTLKESAIDGFKITFDGKADKGLRVIDYSFDEKFNNITFRISVGLAFYLSVMAISNVKIREMMTASNFNNGFEIFKKYIFNLFIESKLNDDFNAASLMISKPKISLKIGSYIDEYAVFKHMVFINSKIANLIGKSFKGFVSSLRSNCEITPSFENKYKYCFMNDLLRIDRKDKNLINDYINNQDEYVDKMTIKVSGKNRQIIKYKNNHKGRHLMRLHKKISDILSLLFVPSDCAFAYKKGSCTRKCLERHLESNHFIKMDVHAFFNSIKPRMLYWSLFKMINAKIGKEYEPLVQNYKMINDVLKCCFYKNHLPLGFITSPILSDIYMHNFDNEINDFGHGIIYSRYADDILISSKRKTGDLRKCEKLITYKLTDLGLSINSKKRIETYLKNSGDSIRFLGINIVKRKSNKELTISKTKLYHFAEMIHKEKHKKHPDESKINGIKQYVLYVSKDSYNHLCKSYLAMFKEKI